MKETAEDYRMWVLRHWRSGGWSIAMDRLRTKKGYAAIARLIKDRLLEKDSEYEHYRITEAGSAVLEARRP